MTTTEARAKVILDGYSGVIEEVALLSSAPTRTTSWAALPRTDYGSYADVSTIQNTTFAAAAAGSRQNVVEITFPQATTAATGNITHVAIRTGAGDEYSFAALTTPRPVGIGETPKFPATNFVHNQT